ncbi:hypothetical protein, partial [Pseudoalteromonas sp. Of7M-16]
YVTADPCMDPRNGCTPHGGDDIQTVDINNEPERVSPMRTTQLGTGSTIAIVDYLKKSNGKNDNPTIIITSYKLTNGKRVPVTMCRPVERFCDIIDMDVTINPGSGVTVNFEERVNSLAEIERYNAIWKSLSKFFEGEYTCVIGETGTSSNGIMKGQLICYWSPY